MVDPVRRPLHVAGATALLAATLLLAGCSGDDGSGAAEPASSSPAATESPSAVDTLIDTGLSQITSGDKAAAQGTFTAVLALDEGNVYAHYNLGYLAQLDNDRATAMKEYQAALATDDAFAPALYNLAILTERTDLEAAVSLYRRGIEANAQDAATYMRLGFALQHLGQTDEGQQMLDQGIALDPSMADVEPPTYAE